MNEFFETVGTLVLIWIAVKVTIDYTIEKVAREFRTRKEDKK